MVNDERKRDGLSRRDFIKGAVAGAAVAASGTVLGGVAGPANAANVTVLGNVQAATARTTKPECAWSRDLALVNGKFVDERGVIASAVAIRDGRIAEIGRHTKAIGPCTQTINLRGHTVIPGLIDSSVHFTRAGTNPGYETRWIETAFSIAELQQVIADRAKTVPEGPERFITAMGGWNQSQFAEGRLPTLAELDAATSTHGVYVNGRTNSVGVAFFAGFGISVDGVTGQVSDTNAATNALRSIQTFEDKVRGTADIIAFAAANGLTSCHDPSNLTVQPDDYVVMNTLYHRSGRSLDVRMRHYRYFATTNLPALVAYMDPIFREAGDDTYRINGVGEQIGSDNDDLLENMRAVARAGWKCQQHFSDAARQVPFFKTVGTEFDISELRWSYAHPGVLTAQQIEDLKSVGVGVCISNGPFRTFVDSGIQAGTMTDATNVAPLSPWVKFYYMLTGKNQAGFITGNVTNVGQQITRLEALRLYTIGSAWFSNEEEELGSFEIGKLADLAVLSDDYLTVSDDRILKIKSVLTLQGGRVVHASGEFAGLAGT
jgi:predicted amidohydrolase YtcJ